MSDQNRTECDGTLKPHQGGQNRTKGTEMSTTMNQSLLELDDETFRQIVDDDVRGVLDEETSRQLRKPDVLERLYFTLVAIKKSVEGQLGAKRNDVARAREEWLACTNADESGVTQDDAARARERAAIAEQKYNEVRRSYRSWRSGALRFKTGLDERVLEIRAKRAILHQTFYDDMMRVERERLADQKRSLLDESDMLWESIKAHRERSEHEEIEPTEADEELWQVLNCARERAS